MSQSLLTTEGLLIVPDEPGVSSGDINMEPIDRKAEEELLDYVESPDHIEPSQKTRDRSSLNKTCKRPSGKKPSHNRRADWSRREDKGKQTRGRDQPRKRRHSETLEPEDLIEQSEQAIKSLKRHAERGTCPKSLQYRARACIRADNDFKSDIKRIRTQAEQGIVGAPLDFTNAELRNTDRI